MNLTQELMAYRTSYLQCIAECWKDSQNANGFISKANESGINILDSELFNRFLPNSDDGRKIKLNWRANLYIILNEGKELASYQPFNPNSLNGWIGGADLLILKIPNKPEGNQSTALAAYYELFNTFFGNSYAANSETIGYKNRIIDSKLLDMFKEYSLKISDYVQATKDNVSSSLGVGGDESFLGIGSLFMNLISVAWNTPGFLNSIKKMTLTPVGTKNSMLKDEFIKFRNPYAFNVKIEEAEAGNSIWNESEARWEKVENNEIFLQFPKKPELKDWEAQALARYNGTGPAYPLTCP